MKCTTKTFRHHVHVDNGGYSIAVEVDCQADMPKTAAIVIEDGYFGYSSTTLKLNGKVTPDNLRKLAEQLIIAARELES